MLFKTNRDLHAIAKTTGAVVLAALLTSGCATQTKTPALTKSPSSDISRQLDKFVAVLDLIEQSKVSEGKASTASTSMKGLVGDIQREIEHMGATPTADDVVTSVSTTAEKHTGKDMSLLVEIFRVMSAQ